MSVSIAFAQTTLALRDLLLAALRADPGWRLTGATPRVTTLPHGKPDKGIGDRLNLALVSALPTAHFRNRLGDVGAPMLSFDLRYLVTAHVFVQHHVELLIGMVLQTIAEAAVLPPVASSGGLVDPIEAGLVGGMGRADDPLPMLAVGDIGGMRLEPVGLPALLIDVSPVVAVAQPASNPLLMAR